MARFVALAEAHVRLGELLDRAQGGEEIVIEQAGWQSFTVQAFDEGWESDCTPSETGHTGRQVEEY
jgi:hypothetical protein